MSERIVLKNVRLSYPHLFQPERFDDNQDAKYSCVLIIRKDDPQLKAIKEAIYKAGAEKWGSKIQPGKWPSNLHWPLKDGDDKADTNPEYAGCYFVSPTSRQPVVLLDRAKRQLTEADDKLYPGAYVNASLAVAAFDAAMKKGVSIYLNGIQFFQDGERLAGHDATADFDQLDEDDFDAFDI